MFSNDLELFDVCDENGNATGETGTRAKAHSRGILHRTAHVWIIDGGNILLQKRSKTKDSYPGLLDISSAGHVDAGDDLIGSALRELKEELGISASSDELEFAGFRRAFYRGEFYGKPFLDNEIAAVYAYRKAVDIKKLVLQTSEVEAVIWEDFYEVLSHVRSGDKRYCIYEDELLMIEKFVGGNCRG